MRPLPASRGDNPLESLDLKHGWSIMSLMHSSFPLEHLARYGKNRRADKYRRLHVVIPRGENYIDPESKRTGAHTALYMIVGDHRESEPRRAPFIGAPINDPKAAIANAKPMRSLNASENAVSTNTMRGIDVAVLPDFRRVIGVQRCL